MKVKNNKAIYNIESEKFTATQFKSFLVIAFQVTK